jgi:hypothetical protein
MRLCVLAAAAVALAGCSTTDTPTTATGATPQQTTNTQREAPVPPALRTPRQRSATGWPDLGYQPQGRY